MFLKAGTWRYTGSCCHSNAFPCVMELLYDFAFKHFRILKISCTTAQKPVHNRTKTVYNRTKTVCEAQKYALEGSKLTLSARKSSKGRRLRHLPSMSVTKV